MFNYLFGYAKNFSSVKLEPSYRFTGFNKINIFLPIDFITLGKYKQQNKTHSKRPWLTLTDSLPKQLAS